MGLFSTDITPEEANKAAEKLNKLNNDYTISGGEGTAFPAVIQVEVDKCKEVIAKFNQQQKDAEDNLKSGLKAALSVLKRFLPKEIKAKIPDDAIDLLFGLIHKPEILVDKINHEWERMCTSLGIPSEHLRMAMQKPGDMADMEAIMLVYNPTLERWIPCEYNFRNAARAIKEGTQEGFNLKRDIRAAYGIQLQESEFKTPPIALSENKEV